MDTNLRNRRWVLVPTPRRARGQMRIKRYVLAPAADAPAPRLAVVPR